MKSISIFLFALILFPSCENSTEIKKAAEKKSCCNTSTSLSTKKDSAELQSEITCPYCGHKKTETMPTDVCRLKYTCENCKKDLLAKEGDCCVFCSYGSQKCPSKQEEK
jgi:hypothetical protein